MSEKVKFRPKCPILDTDCLQTDCELWLESVYSTEGIQQPGRCAIRFMAEKNSEGKLPV